MIPRSPETKHQSSKPKIKTRKTTKTPENETQPKSDAAAGHSAKKRTVPTSTPPKAAKSSQRVGSATNVSSSTLQSPANLDITAVGPIALISTLL